MLCNYSMTTLFLALKILLATTAAPMFVDACDDDLCSVLDTAGNVSTVPRVSLPSCASEGAWTYAGKCLDAGASALAHEPLTSDISL